MKLAQKSKLKIEEFFREYLSDEKFQLPEICFYAGRLTQVLTSVLNTDGITIGRRIFIFPGNFRFDENELLKLDPKLAVHEIAHVLQYQREGFGRFLWLYMKSFLLNLKPKKKWDLISRTEAYLDIPYEIEAREIASKFKNWSKNRKIK
ncbi:MAG: DUF4157 domain-containing protein [Actinomycetota bacterium]